MDLETAAKKTLDEAQELAGLLETAARDVSSAEDRLETVERRFEQQWEPLEKAGRELLEELRKLRDNLDTEAKQQIAELVGLRGRVEWAQDQGLQAIHATESEVKAFTARAQELDPELQEALRHVEEVGTALRDRAKEVESKLQEVSQEVAQLMNGEILSDIQTMQGEFEERVEALKGYVTGESLPNIKQKADELNQKLDEFRSNLQTKLDDLAEAAQTSAQESVQKALEKHHEVFEQFTKIGEQAKEVLEKLGKAVDDGGTAIGEGKDLIEAGVKGTSVGLQAAIGTLDELMQMFKKFSFIPL
jgi:ABC-type transporter Mla subunit MlaD